MAGIIALLILAAVAYMTWRFLHCTICDTCKHLRFKRGRWDFRGRIDCDKCGKLYDAPEYCCYYERWKKGGNNNA